MSTKAVVYVKLLDEGTEVWRPVAATEASGAYLLEGPVPLGERWEFGPGTLVWCQARRLQAEAEGTLVPCAIKSAASPAFILELVRVMPEARPLLDEHITDNGDVLPHVLMGAVTRLAVSAATSEGNDDMLDRLLGFFELQLRSKDDVARELILASFVENLAGEPAAVKAMWSSMGPLVRASVKKILG